MIRNVRRSITRSRMKIRRHFHRLGSKRPKKGDYAAMEYQSKDVILPRNDRKGRKPWRALVSYWILGLCNNYGYVVMLTAASDIIGESEGAKSTERNCTYMSTGAILLADIIPSLLVKLLAPFLPFFVNVRVAVCILCSSAGFLLVAFSQNITMSLLGVVATSFCSGLGEVTYLQYSSFYDKNVVSTWSSGTGGAGVIGAVSYSLLQQLGLKTTLLVMLLVPGMMAVTFYIILPSPEVMDENDIQADVNNEEIKNPKEAFMKKLKHVPSLFKYMIPFGLVYFLEYYINQGTFELINFENTFLAPSDQYRWLQVAYQIGVFVSRSSVNFFHIRHIWVMSVLQAVNVVIFTTEVIYYYMPSFWIILALTLWEGLLGGAAYVNTFYRISTEVREENKQFSMAITSFADSIGITLAGIVSIYAHNAICSLPKPQR
ncbi:battenin isoform X1 [Tribolium castaneum]|nr:PREDICTED: battenin isoform X1 [Tribolium castaneum]|eukprot:XP_971061.2 PREDICTED: battenin isoform X1 [Tribolium castaneum]